jgi:hypothetical protein
LLVGTTYTTFDLAGAVRTSGIGINTRGEIVERL